jgi:hypothetical protein
MTAIPDHVPDNLHQPATAPDYTRADILRFASMDHDMADPESGFNRARMALVGVEMARDFCRHCSATFRLQPTPGTGWLIEWFHAEACPDRAGS